MPDNIELVNMMRAVIQEELKPVHQELHELKKGQVAIEAAVSDLRTINRATHKKIFAHLDAIWNDVKLIEKRLDVQNEQEEEVVR
ncbi:hypothetical protein [Desulfoscipio gibsoniae]